MYLYECSKFNRLGMSETALIKIFDNYGTTGFLTQIKAGQSERDIQQSRTVAREQSKREPILYFQAGPGHEANIFARFKKV